MKRIYFIFSILVVLVLSSCEYYTYNSLDYAIDETFNYYMYNIHNYLKLILLIY